MVLDKVIDVTGQGNPGGDGVSSGGPAYGSGGGGGAGGAGSKRTSSQPGGHGGLGIQLPSIPRSNFISWIPGPGPATFFVAGGGGGV